MESHRPRSPYWIGRAFHRTATCHSRPEGAARPRVTMALSSHSWAMKKAASFALSHSSSSRWEAEFVEVAVELTARCFEPDFDLADLSGERLRDRKSAR